MSDPLDLARRIAAPHWETVDGRAWCPILAFKEPPTWLGLTRDAGWALLFPPGSRPGLHALEEPAVVSTLPMLEVPYGDVVRRLEQRADELGLPRQALLGAFPAPVILGRALATSSDYWIALAADWLGHGAPGRMQLAPALSVTVADRRVPQQLRHRLRGLFGPAGESGASR